MMSDQETGRSTPQGTPASPGLVNYVVLAILLCPLALVAAGVGAFVGQWAAVAGWGTGALEFGTGVGGGMGLLLLGACAFAFVVRAKPPKLDPMAYAQKVASFIADMKTRGLSPNAAFPLPFQLAARLGFQLPPPLFVSFRGNFVWSGGLMLAFGASACALLWWDRPSTPASVMGVVALIALLVAGLVAVLAAAGVLRKAREYQLPPWDRYGPSLAVGRPEGNHQEVRSQLPG
jgi:hypothetical protein